MGLFDATTMAKCSAERLAAIEFCGGDKKKADAVIAEGDFIFLPKAKTVKELGAEATCASAGRRLSKKYLQSVDTEWQGEYELYHSGGMITRYGFFQLRGGSGLIEKAVRKKELESAVENVATDVFNEMIAEGYRFFK